MQKKKAVLVAVIAAPLLLPLVIILLPLIVIGLLIWYIRRCYTKRDQRDLTLQSPVVPVLEDWRPTNIDRHDPYEHLLDVGKCIVEWNHGDHAEVGISTAATVKLKCRNSQPYVLGDGDRFTCSVELMETRDTIPHVVEPSPPNGSSTLTVSFSTRKTGKYTIDIGVNGKRLPTCPIIRHYCAGPVDPSKTVFLDQRQVLILIENTYYCMHVVPKDRFGNAAILLQELLTAEVRKNSAEGEPINPECVAEQLSDTTYELLLKVDDKGHYVGCIQYGGERIGPPSFTIICLTESDEQILQRKLSSGLFTRFDAKVIEGSKKKNVSCLLSPRLLHVRKHVMWKIPTKKIFSCRVCASTKINFHEEPEHFTLDDGFQAPLTMVSKHREILGAVFYSFVLQAVGGSEKFEEKRKYFYNELREHHSQHGRSGFQLTVSREHLLRDAMQMTKRFKDEDWCKTFNLTFAGEPGLDYGGLRREFFELLCVELFEVSGLFRRFQDSPQALLHPNPKWRRQAHLSLKHYEFAGKVVGKCLYECAKGEYPILVKARFTRSFLAQIIGLRINYKYFESDDPELYTTKIKYILENEVSDMELVFAEEEFESGGGIPRVVPLKLRGEQMLVTEHNKSEYLNLLAQYKLEGSVKEEIEHFLNGLNSIIPDDLLSVFDENELELLMSGLDSVNDEDLKLHANVPQGGGARFQQVVSWFWVLVKSLTQEERSRLLQFVTGSSQVPPGGFKELRPPFHIIPAPTHGVLPTAHTCFNQICLPSYDSYEQFHSKFMVAINEGYQGFGFL